MSFYCKKTGGECYGIRELTLLFEVSTLLNKNYKLLKNNLFVPLCSMSEVNASDIFFHVFSATDNRVPPVWVN